MRNGVVVRANGGNRGKYEPWHSPLAGSADCGDVARAFIERFALRSAYVADLDAIAGGPVSHAAIRELIDAGLTLWLDPGLRDAESAEHTAAEFGPCAEQITFVAGSETVAGPAELSSIVSLLGPHRVVFSLDLRAGCVLSPWKAWRDEGPMATARAAVRAGIRSILVLDLGQVGSGKGAGTETLCQSIKQIDDRLRLAAGGGVASANDLSSLAAAGCQVAVVASALHDGRLSPEDIARCQRL